MSRLKEMLQKNRERMEFLASGNAIEDFREERLVKPLPVEKPINATKGVQDEAFILIPDIHSYQRDKKAYDAMMESLPHLAKLYNVTKFVQLGDLLEVGEASTHPKTSVFDRVPKYLDEVSWAINDFWKPAMKACPDANFYALMGNHENRWDKKIAKEILAKRLVTQEYAQQMYADHMPTDLYEELGIHVTPYGNEAVGEGILELIPNRLIAVHGWSFSKHSSATHLTQVQGAYSVVYGHTHRAQSHVVRNPVTRRRVEAWSFGALAKPEMKWHNGNPNDHVLGFGLVNVHGSEFNIQCLSIEIDKDSDSRTLILPDGKVIIKK